MTAALCLFKMEWYSQFNGKNMGGILIPKVKTTRPKTKGKSTHTNKKKQTQRIATLEELGIPLDLNLFNQSILYSQGDKFSTVAWTTLNDCRREFFDIGKNMWSEDEIIKIVEKCRTLKEFRTNNPGAAQSATRKGKQFYDKIKEKLQTITYWNYDKCKKTATQYNKFSEFAKKEASCLNHARDNNFIDDITKHMIKINNVAMSLKEFNSIVKNNNLKNKQDLRNYKGSNLRKIAYRLNVWDNFPNAKRKK
jgi:hypothetical protein